MNQLVRVAFFDDDLLRRSALASLLQCAGCYHVAAQYGLCPKAVRAGVAHGLDGAIMVVDRMSETEHALGEALREQMGPRSLVLCTLNNAAWKDVERLMEANPAAVKWRPDLCVGAVCDSTQLLQCLNGLFRPACAADSAKPKDTLQQKALASLSLRERDVYQRIGAGISYKQIGLELDISHKTVETHASRMCAKLGLAGSRALFRMAASQTLALSAFS